MGRAPRKKNTNATQLLLDKPRVFWGQVVAVFIRRGWSPPPPDERITEQLLDEFEKLEYIATVPVDLPDIDDAAPLTDREKQIVQLLMVGFANADIADALGISQQTVKYHLTNVYRKLGVTTRAQVVAMFHRDI